MSTKIKPLFSKEELREIGKSHRSLNDLINRAKAKGAFLGETYGPPANRPLVKAVSHYSGITRIGTVSSNV